MSRSKKDGARRGGHRDTQNREVWSRRCRAVVYWSRDTFGWKQITHRYERRVARAELRSALATVEVPHAGE